MAYHSCHLDTNRVAASTRRSEVCLIFSLRLPYYCVVLNLSHLVIASCGQMQVINEFKTSVPVVSASTKQALLRPFFTLNKFCTQ